MMKIGFIGLGIMGKPMAKNLLKAGYTDLLVNNRSQAPVQELEAAGAKGATQQEIGAQCDVVITMVGFPQDVEEVYFTPGNILDSAAQGTILMDMTTTSPTLAQRIYREGTARGLRVLDAPVTGGDSGAKAGTLSILVGGDRADFDTCLSIFRAMGTNITYFGPAGCGQHAKMANQIMIAGALSGVCEALAYAKAEGLDWNTLLGAVATGAAGSKQLDFQGRKILAGDFTPGFFMKHFVKDMKLAEEEADTAGLDLNVLRRALDNCQALVDQGCGDLGTQALIKFYEK
ncbi:MAG: NAD(P)-dependent oxidoreductase [Clostridiales bacterium]|nr:NAD(P)-dependent oxidoreductase [Clostridiales bacterium]